MIIVVIASILVALYFIGKNSKITENKDAQTAVALMSQDREKLSILDNTISSSDYDLKDCRFLERSDKSKILFCISKIKDRTAGFYSKDNGVEMVVVEAIEPELLAHEFVHSETRYWSEKGYSDVYSPETQEKWAYSVQNLMEQILKT